MMNLRTVICTRTTPDFATQLTTAVHGQNGHLRWATSVIDWADALDQHFPHVAFLDIDQEPQSQVSQSQKSQSPHLLASSFPEGHIPDSCLSEQPHSDLSAGPARTGHWESVLQRVKLRPHTKYIPIVAFSQNDEAARAIANQLGAEETWLYAALIGELPNVIQQYLDPPIRYIDGWDEALPSLAIQGLRHFNAGDFFEQHELLEDAWRAEARPIRELYQGILQIGVAFYQIELGNWKGAIKTFRRGLPKLRALPPTIQGIELAPFRASAEELHAELTTLGPENMAQFDQSRFPKIRYANS